ncbi:KpsF/GutQ family sugar-phosphate isomerase [Sphingomonas fennica]|uniref:KpsF/GutQ family sugar-phosphate isomerase n=1 Tax=Edaphosphingomonas fennica TaxID=114404 RepID=UPI001FE4E852|nr:KpsF/GutQ family sugar-phosphate isomerase [Sphingomonas fennica]
MTRLVKSTALADATTRLATGRSVIWQEAQALLQLGEHLGDSFEEAVEQIVATQGRIVVTGVGKSGHIGRKIAATFSATGTPAFFVHAGEAAHGDLGMLCSGDALLILSNSGASAELRPIILYAKRLGIPIIGVASKADSPLMWQAGIRIRLPLVREACPEQIAPTTTTTMMLALGDALAIAAMQARGVTRADLVQWHPGGAIGWRNQLVDQLLRRDAQLPLVTPETSMRDLVFEMTSTGKGVAGVVDAEGDLIGIVTDGDVRRAFDRVLTAVAGDIMTSDPYVVLSGTLIESVLELMKDAKITVVFVMDPARPRKPIGLVHIHDLAMAV